MKLKTNFFILFKQILKSSWKDYKGAFGEDVFTGLNEKKHEFKYVQVDLKKHYLKELRMEDYYYNHHCYYFYFNHCYYQSYYHYYHYFSLILFYFYIVIIIVLTNVHFIIITLILLLYHFFKYY